ncbi:AAA family ATPase [Exilibacterium tricleocarpae]|uniref:DNA 3'-5' helicase n=1 Tax=Exilibacterium tricleocarpae TaxID=2591008 RepID=A0A545TVM8_9GAMM|nr:UvrD-helicase domain-containing protein [Exilibacterium tricleocarpae]TQV81280.1 AAA family ATPase [Exilibacterium tricleocarpae]
MSETLLDPATPVDGEARAAALDPRHSFAVVAPAGSGKTGLLTQRVLRLLAHCDHPEEVLCITFTRKAAAEMQHRIVSALVTAAAPPADNADPHQRLTRELALAVLARDRELGWHLLLAPNRLRIHTIDGFARSLTRQLPIASGLGAQPDTLEQPEIAYQTAVAETLNLLESDTPFHTDLQRLLAHLDNNLNAVQSLLIALLRKRDQWLGSVLAARDARAYLEAVLTTVAEETLDAAAAELAPVGAELAALADYAAGQLLATATASPITACQGLDELPAASAEQQPLWTALLELLLTKAGTWRASIDKRSGFPPGVTKAEKAAAKARKQALLALIAELRERPGLLQCLQAVRHLPPHRYAEDQWQLLDSLTRLLPVLVAQLRLVFGQLGATDFVEITQAAGAALGDDEQPSDLALKLDYRIRHILVDEFQDTATPQLTLLRKLMAGWQPGDGRTLFIVGDGMQSCYGFRNANVGIFLDAREHGIGAIPLQSLDLHVNFRSHKTIVDWVNQVFSQALPAQNNINRGAVHYTDSTAFKPDAGGSEVSVWACPDAADRQPEAQRVVQLVAHCLQHFADDNIAILVRNRNHLRDILATLSRAGINWQATDIDPLAGRMAIVDLISLTRAMLDPGDRIAWLAVLRAPWCGLDLADLLALATTDLGALNPPAEGAAYPLLWQQIVHHRAIATLSAGGRQQLDKLCRVLEPAWAGRGRKPLRLWLEGIWLALGGPAALLDDTDLENVPRYFDLLEHHSRPGGLDDWQAFYRAVEQLYAAPGPTADARLQVMTIHKSKGLEFDTVIIPGLDRLPRQDDHELLLWQEYITRSGDKQLLLGPLAATGEDQDPIYRYLRREQSQRAQLESTRLLYVGCTRAIKRLHLVANVTTDDAGDDLKPPPAKSLLAGIWPAVKNQLLTDTPAVSPDTASEVRSDTDREAAQQPDWASRHILRLAPDFNMPPLADTGCLAAYRGRDFDTGEDANLPSPADLLNRAARHTGTVLHRCLCQITREGLALWDSGRLDRQRHFWHQQLRQLGIDGDDLTRSLDKIQTAVASMLADATGRWLLDPDHKDSACELPLYQTSADRQRLFIIDRTFIDGGYRWIVDYKSSEPAAGETQADFIAAALDTYRSQLEGYGELFYRGHAEPVRLALYFPLLQCLAELPPSQTGQESDPNY